MIYGVSHVVAATAGPVPACVPAWRDEFACSSYDVHTGKGAYLSTPHAKHDFTLFRGAGAGPAVEIVSYHETSGRRGAYHVAFGSDAVPEAIAAARHGGVSPRKWPGAGDVELVGSADQPPTAVAIATDDLAAGTQFWAEGLGFGVIESGNGSALLRPQALSPNWRMDIVLVAVDGATGDGMLDDAGWNCISLLAGKLEADAARALMHGGRTPTDRLSQLVDDRYLDLQFIRGPSGEVIELLDSTSAMKSTASK